MVGKVREREMGSEKKRLDGGRVKKVGRPEKRKKGKQI